MEPHTVCILFVQASLLLLVSGALISIGSGKRTNATVLSTFLFAACFLLLCGCIGCWPDGFAVVLLPVYLGGLVPLVHVGDALSMFFLAILTLVGMAVALFSPAYLSHLQGRFNPAMYWFALFVFIGSMAQVFMAHDAITFIVFWEAMSLSSVALVITDYASRKAKNAALIYLGATRVATTLLLAGFIWLHALSKSWMFADFNALGSEALIPLALVFAGLCIKAGTWPFHLWLPYAHTEAPAPISALMSGVMVKVAVYGMIRLVLMAHTPSLILAYSAMALGIISAFWGIMFAQVEDDLKRLLAYSTVENIGLIVFTIGFALLGKASGITSITSIAIAACLLHVLNHGTYKPLLFLGAGAVDWAAHSRDFSRLGGLQRFMPWTALMFCFGSMAICALPPLNGFASKWLIYQGLFQFSIFSTSIFNRALGITIIGLLAMIGAMSLAAFTKAFGLCFLGRPRSLQAEQAKEMPESARAAQGLLMVACILISLGAATIVQGFAPITAGILPSYNVPVKLPEPQLVIALLVLLPAFYLVLIDLGRRRVKRFSTWECGYGELPPRANIGAASFSRSLANMFGMLIQHRVFNKIYGHDRRHFPDNVNVKYYKIFVVEKYIYGPMLHALDAVGRGLIRLQTGSIHIHLLYVFATLILLVFIGIRTLR